MTLTEGLAAYEIYAKAEGNSPKTVIWIESSVGYFTKFLGTDRKEIGAVTANDLRQFIITLQTRPKYANHPHNKTQPATLSMKSIDNYCRGLKSYFAFLKRGGFPPERPLSPGNSARHGHPYLHGERSGSPAVTT
jgi:hypothetical protein